MGGSAPEGKDLKELDRVEPFQPLTEDELMPKKLSEPRNYAVDFDSNPINLIWLPGLLVVLIVELSLRLPAVVDVLSVAALSIAFLLAWSRFRRRE